MSFQFTFAAFSTLLFSLIVAYYYYYKFSRKDLAMSVVIYSFLIFNIVYFVSFENNLGLGIGLLGILSIIRLRSMPESLTDISFIFYAITLGLLNASIADWQVLLFANGLLSFVVIFLSSNILFKHQLVQTQIVFDELIVDKLGDESDLKQMIKKKYHIDPVSVQINKIDYLKDSVTLDVSYHAKSR